MNAQYERTPVVLKQVPLGDGDWNAIRAAIGQQVGWQAGEGLLVYEESVSQCGFKLSTFADYAPPIDAMEGRLIGESADVRWVARGVDAFQAWATIERPVDENRSPNAWRSFRDYVLLGHGTNQPGALEEARYPGVKFKYPTVQGIGAATRAALVVAEYYAMQPANREPLSEAETQLALAKPLLVAHRFTNEIREVSNA